MAVAAQVQPLKNAMTRRQQREENAITGQDSLGRSQPDKISPRVQGKNAFNLRRQQITSQEQAARERQQSALKRRLSTQGLSGGLAAQQQRLLDAEARKIEAARKGEVDIQELQAAERERALEGQRRFQTGERRETQGFQAEQEAQRAERAAREAAKQREFQTGERVGQQEFQTTFTTGREQFQAEQAEKNRIAQKAYNDAQLSLREKELAQESDQFNSRQEFERFALERGFQENEIQRAWETQKIADQNIFEAGQTLTKQKFNQSMVKLENELALGRLSFGQKIQEQNQINSLKSDKAYNLGKSGKGVSALQFSFMSDLEKASYKAGQAGQSVEQHEQQKQALINYRNALITTLDPDNPKFVSALNSLMTQTGTLRPNQLINAGQFQNLLNQQSKPGQTGETQTVVAPTITRPSLRPPPRPTTIRLFNRPSERDFQGRPF